MALVVAAGLAERESELPVRQAYTPFWKPRPDGQVTRWPFQFHPPASPRNCNTEWDTLRRSGRGHHTVLIREPTLSFLATGVAGLISCLCLTLWLTSANNRVSASGAISQLELELRQTSLFHCNFPCNRLVSVQTGLKRESDSKRNKTQARAKTGRGSYSEVVSQQVSCFWAVLANK